MKPGSPKSPRLLLAFVALLGATSAAFSADWYLQANNGLSQHWHTPEVWWSQPSAGGTHPTAFDPADIFHTNGYQLRTPETSVVNTFAGGALVLDGGSILAKQVGSTNALSIPAFLAKGGTSRTISNGNNGVRLINIGSMLTARSEATVFSTGGNTRGLDVAIDHLAGDGDLNFNGGGTVELSIADGAAFYGTLYVTANTTLTISGDIAVKGNLVVEAGSKIILADDLSVSFASIGGTLNNTDRLWGLHKSGTALAANTTHTSAALQSAHPAIFIGGSGNLVVGRPVLAVNAANVIDNVGHGQMGMNLSAGKFWQSFSPNYRKDIDTLRAGMIRTAVTPEKNFSLQDMDIRVAQILNSGGVPLFVGPITKPNPPFNTKQQHLHDNFLKLDGTPGSGTMATNIAYLVQHYMAPPFNLATQYWEVGNEPDITVDYQVASPQEYVDIYQSIHNQLVASGVRQNVILCGPVTAFEYGFAANGNRSDTIMRAFIEQTAAPLNGHRQVDIVTRHLYAEIYDWETDSPDPVENAYNLLNHPTEQVSFTPAHVQPWTYRGESAIQALLRQHGHPADVGTGITEFNVPLQFRHTITQGLWFLTYGHFALYNPANVLGSGFAFDIKTNAAMHYYSGGLPNHAWWATYVHGRLTGTHVLEQHSSDSHLLVSATQDERHVYVQVLNRDVVDITATLDIAGAPVAGSTHADLFVMSATELPDTLVPTSLGTSFSYTYPAMTARIFRFPRSDAPPLPPPPAAPANVVLDTDFTTAPSGMFTYHTGSFQPAIVGGDLKLTHNSSNLTTAVVFNGQPLATSQKRMRAEYVYKMTNGHAGSGFVFAAYSANPGGHGAGLDGLGIHGQPNVLFGVKRKVKGALLEHIAITSGDITPDVEGFTHQPVPEYPSGYNTDMFVIVDYDGDAGTVRVRLHEGSDDTGALLADIVNRVGVPASLPAGTVFGFTSSTASGSQINWIRQLKITTDNGTTPVIPSTPGATFTLQSWTGSPWNAVNLATSFSGGFSPDSTPVTLTFANPKTGVNITNPAAPDFTGAVDSFFGFESSGFGVGNSGLGRFERGESFTLTATHAFVLQSINWREHNGDEVLHIRWTQGGVVQQQLFNITGDPHTFTGIHADANTPVVITNVSPNTNLSGRLRFEQIFTALLF